MSGQPLSIRNIVLCTALACASIWGGSVADAQPAAKAALNTATISSPTSTLHGQTVTALPDGNWLLLGGADTQGKPSNQAWLVRADGSKSPLATGLRTARSGHTATVLPDGRILVIGGVTEGGQPVSQAELWDAKTQQPTSVVSSNLLPRTQHTATVLPDGRVLIVGGLDAKKTPLLDIELWNPSTANVDRFTGRLSQARAGHQATLLPDGTVLISAGLAVDGQATKTAELLDVVAQRSQSIALEKAQAEFANLNGSQLPALFSSSPSAEAKGFDSTQPAVLRFNKQMLINSVSAQSVTLIGPGGAEPLQVVPVEQGIMAFVTPGKQLLPASRYTLFINGATDKNGQRLPLTAIGFDTAALGNSATQRVGAANASSGYPASATGLSNAVTPANTSALSNGVGTNFVARPLDAKTLAAMQADDELFVPSEANRKGYWISGKGERALLVPPRNQKLREALYGEQERLQKILEQRATDAGIDLKANPKASAYAPVSLDGVLDSNLRKTSSLSTASDTQATSAKNHKVRLEWADIAHSAPSAVDKRAALLNAKSDAANGTTSLAGQVLRLNGKPLANVTLSVAGTKVKTDEQGEFLLSGLPAGPQVLSIDGRSANRADAQYGVFQYRLDIQAGQANTLPFVVWMPKLDTRNAIKIDSPTRAETVISHPLIPGLQVVLPAGTVVRDADGKVVTEVSITPVPVDQTPFPMPFVGVPVFYTLQPGGAVLQGVDGRPRAATLKYPNYTSFGPGESMQLFDYDPQGRGWYVYGQAKVSSVDPTTITAAQPFSVYQFTIHSVSSGGPAGAGACGCGCGGGGSNGGKGSWGQGSGGGGGDSCGGDPVDMTTGHFAHIERDLMIDDVSPIDIRRAYRSLDNKGSSNQEHVRAFGVGTTHQYEMYLRLGAEVGTFKSIQLIMPNGRVIPFSGALEGGYNQTYSNFESSGEFRGAKMLPIGNEFVLYFRDGRQWAFGKAYARIKWMEDRNGNRTTIERINTNGYAKRITSPNGRWVDFTYNANGRIEKISDNIGRNFTYTYDAGQRLTEVTDPLGKKRIYIWDTVMNRITSIKDPNGNTRVTNEYDAAGRVRKQTLADGSTYQWVYTLDGAGKMSQVDFTDRRGTVRRLNFDPQGWLVKNTFALGTPEQYVETYEYSDGLNTARIDGLGRRTEYQYDAYGNLTKTTLMAGTPSAVSVETTYDPVFNQPLTITDPLGNKSSMTYDGRGNLIQVTDPLVNRISISHDAQGRPLNITNQLSKVSKLAYDGADLSTVTDALNRVVRYRADGVGRVLSTTDPLGNRSLQDWDSLNRLVQITNPMGNTVKFTYDNNGFIKTQVDERGVTAATYTYNGTGQTTSVKDALNQTETMAYDSAGQVRQRIDRKGQLSAVTYDALSRVKRVGYGATAAAPTAFKSVVEFTWDKASRLTQVVDKTCANPTTSLNCATVGSSQTITTTYDNFDQPIKEVTPQGEVNYTYDKAGRRATMVVKNGVPGSQTTQPTVSYTWDAASRLTKINQAAGAINGGVAQAITLAYDKASRRTQTTLANGSTITYTYDDADQLKSMAYTKADGSVIGDLTYTYDNAGRRTSMGGSLAKIDLPAANVLDATYDANNRLTKWNGKTFTYDATGNLIADGTSTYQWDERGQLKGVSTGVTGLASFQYDSQGKRTGKTVGSTTTGFLYDGDNFIQELNGTANTSPVRSHLLTGGIDETFLRIEGANLQSFLPDGNNNTVRLLDKNQNKLVDYSYEAYGKTKQDAANTNSQQYTGRENDNPGNDNGLYYYRARYYIPGCARFISEDPIGWASGQTNSYSYVGGDPVSFSDPTGNFAGGPLGAALGVAGDIALQLARNKGDWRCIDLVETAAAAAVGFILPGALGTVGKLIKRTPVPSEIRAGALAGAFVNATYSMTPPELDGVYGRLSLRLGDVVGGGGGSCK